MLWAGKDLIIESDGLRRQYRSVQSRLHGPPIDFSGTINQIIIP
jgi:hypothetical protein